MLTHHQKSFNVFWTILNVVMVVSLVWIGSLSATYATQQSYFYIETESLPPVLLDAPPVVGSGAWKKQIEAVVTLQKNISKQDLKAFKDEQHMRLELMTTPLGPDFKRDKYPKTFLLLDRVTADTEQITAIDKAFWHTKRPYLTNHAVKLLVDPLDQNPSYPSGHATISHVLAEVLGMLYPNKREELRARADTISQHRVEAGVHYPVDLEGGKELAVLIVGALSQSDEFDDDLSAARDEITPAN